MNVQATGTLKQTQSSFSIDIPRIISNISQVALPIITLIALDNLPGVSGGPLTYAACCVGCTALLPPAVPACLNVCLGFLFLPGP